MNIRPIWVVMLAALLSFPAVARGGLYEYEIQFNINSFYITRWEATVVLPGSPYFLGTTVSQSSDSGGGPISRFFLDSSFGNATSLSNIVSTRGMGWLCAFGNCFSNLSAAGLSLDASPNIMGLVNGQLQPFSEEIAFDGWYTSDGLWENVFLPPIPVALKMVGANQFVHRTADFGYREIDFGTYSIRQVPEPSTLILLGIGLVGLAVRFRKRFTR